MPSPRNASAPITPVTRAVSLKPKNPYKDTSSAMPLLKEGVVKLKLVKFEPNIKEGQDFNFMFNLKATLVEPWKMEQPEGQVADAGYPVFDGIWLGDTSSPETGSKDMSASRDRKIAELTEAFYTREEIEKWGDEIPDLQDLLQAKYGAEFHAHIVLRPESTNPKTGQTFPPRNEVKKYIPL